VKLKKGMRVICSGGGTGGHIFPAVAVAQELKKRNPSTEVLFIGAKGKMEMSKVPKAGFKIKGLWISGFQRRLTFMNISFPFKLICSIFRARSIIRDFNPDVVAGFGGFASGAALWTAGKMNIPTLIQEQNSYPGVTNKILGRSVNTVCTAYDASSKYFKGPKVVLTGNPVRAMNKGNMLNSDARIALGLEGNKKTIMIIGGSLGAKSMNEALRSGVDEIRKWEDVQVIWQCGGAYYGDYKDCETAKLADVLLVEFIEDMDVAYAATDLVICRAGALTISELMILGKPAILIPSPNVAEDHQTKNAKALVELSAAVMVKDSEMNERLFVEIRRILDDDDVKNKLISRIKKLARPNAPELIVDELEFLFNKRTKQE
jgi:UDP-N-acetylglucosamine--N-acetylmuramyl-(pentapeptide) pyrophosphoryl-undecaprenol N-acetylglucosamine transferase